MIIEKLSALSRKKIALLYIGAIVVALLATVAVEFIYADKYPITVNVTKERKIGVNPLATSLDFGDLNPGGSAKRFLTVENRGRQSSFIVIWAMGGITELIDTSERSFSLKPGKRKKITFLLKIPASASYQIYGGRLFVFRLPKLF